MKNAEAAVEDPSWTFPGTDQCKRVRTVWAGIGELAVAYVSARSGAVTTVRTCRSGSGSAQTSCTSSRSWVQSAAETPVRSVPSATPAGLRFQPRAMFATMSGGLCCRTRAGSPLESERVSGCG